jgi:2-hydroxychromene-2-carboxylate isomerase
MRGVTSVDFYFDVVCPYAYLAHTQIEALCREHGAELCWRPILLGGLFRVIGAGEGPNATMSPAKARLNLIDMQRWAAAWEVPLVMPRGHPRRTVLAMRAIIASSDVAQSAKALFRRYWVDGLDVSDESVVRDALDAAGLDGAEAVRRAADPAIKEALVRAVDEAAAAGAFGVPTFVVRREGEAPSLVWGQDRLHFVRAAIDGSLEPA